MERETEETAASPRLQTRLSSRPVCYSISDMCNFKRGDGLEWGLGGGEGGLRVLPLSDVPEWDGFF